MWCFLFFFFFSFSLKAKISFLLKLYLVLQPKRGSGTTGTLLWLFHWSVTINNSLIIISRNTPNLLLDVQNTYHKLIHTPNYMQKYPGCDTVWSPPLKIPSYAPDVLLILCFWQGHTKLEISNLSSVNWSFSSRPFKARRKVLNNYLEGVRFYIPLYTKR